MKTFKKLIFALTISLSLLLFINLAMMQWNVSYLGDNNVNHLRDNDDSGDKLERNRYIKKLDRLVEGNENDKRSELSDEKKKRNENQNNEGIERIKREETKNNELNKKVDKTIKVIKISDDNDAYDDGKGQKNRMENEAETNNLSDYIIKNDHDNIKEYPFNAQDKKEEHLEDYGVKSADDVTKKEKAIDNEESVNDETNTDSADKNSEGEFSKMKEPTDCTSPPHRFFPFCETQRNHVQKKVSRYRTPCYTDIHNVSNTRCSIYEYLAKVEQVCVGSKHLYEDYRSAKYATPNYDLDGLLKILSNPLFEWLRDRIRWSWPTWVEAVKKIFLKKQNKRLRYKQKNVFIYMGAPLLEPDFFNYAKKGGPVGELVQWADLIAANYVLGYNITILMNEELYNYVTLTVRHKNVVCASKYTNTLIDVLYTDITGTILLHRDLGSDAGYSKIKCTFRVLDSFGTNTEFNFGHHPFRDKTIYGNRNLYMTQFLNLFPHTHDNSFLGFIVDNKWKMNTNRTAKEDIALVYGKQCNYMKGHQRYLEIVSEYFKLHLTCVDNKENYLSSVPFIAVNHGVVSSSRVQELLLKSKIFIGLGFPYEGPGPLEAMAAGTVFLQPRFNPPKNKLNTPFFQSKPTFRLLTSQNPYMEDVVGEPYCFTIDVHNSKELRTTLAKIKAMPSLSGKIPKEYTSVGFLERVIVFNEKMDFCNPYAPRWPPLRNLIILYGSKGQSCKETCMAKGLFCEHTYFDQINSIKTIEKYSGEKCVSVKKGEFELHSPSYDSRLKTCFIKQGFIYSCMHTAKDVNRICPCRNYEYEQTAICKGCL